MSDRDIESALTFGAAGGVSLQQYSYEYPDSGFKFVADNDVLEPAVVDHYEPPSIALSGHEKQCNQVVRPVPVPNLDDVEPFMSLPDFVEKPGLELEALLSSQHIQNPYPYPGNIDILPSYSTQTPESYYSRNLRAHVKHSLNHCWKYDPMGCSVKAALQNTRGLSERPDHGFTRKLCIWITNARLKMVKKARSTARANLEQVRKTKKRMKKLDEDDEILSVDGDKFIHEVDKFYGPDSTDLRPIDSDSDEGFSEPNAIATTVVSLPDKSLMEKGVTPGGIFQDSGISMDEGYAEYFHAHSHPSTAQKTTGIVPNDWPKFDADVAPLRTPKKEGRWLALVGGQKQREWPGRRQGPYDLHGLRSQGKLNSDSSEATSQLSGQKQSSVVRCSNKDRISNKDIGNNAAFVRADDSFSEDGSQNSCRKGNENGLSLTTSHVVGKLPHNNIDASAHSRRSISNVAVTTPANQRICQIPQVPVEAPATPATVEIDLTTERNSNIDASDASDDSLEVRLPKSPTTDTQKGQSVLGRYIQETTSNPELARRNSSTMSIDGSEYDEVSLLPTQKHPSQPKGYAEFSKGVDLHQKMSDAVFTLNPPKAPQVSPSANNIAPIPVTPANETDPASFRPITPFQLGTPAHEVLDNPGTPTPAPNGSKTREKTVTNVFKSAKLGSRSPEHATPHSDFVVAPTTPVAGSTVSLRGSPFGGQGLLFQKAKKNQRATTNVLNSLKLNPGRGSGISDVEKSLDEYEDELAGGSGVDFFGGKSAGKAAPMTRSSFGIGGSGGKMVAQAVVVPRVRNRGDEEDDDDDGRDLGPWMKKARRSLRKAGEKSEGV